MDELEKSIPPAESMVDAEQSSERKHPNEFCLNCGTALSDTFCQHCGQKDIAKRQTLDELLTNFISSFWSYEGKFFKTIKFLIIEPGYLATEYNAGKRESYYHPARMYVFISFVFFLLLATLPSDQDKTDLGIGNFDVSYSGQKNNASNSSVKTMGDTINTATSMNNDSDFTIIGDYKSRKAYDSTQAALPIDQRDGWLMHRLTLRSIEINEKYHGKPEQFLEEFRNAFLDNFSKVLFWLLPFFALLLKILYIRRDYFYSEHLVFSIYFYNFFFFAGSLRIIASSISFLAWASPLINIWVVLYLLFAMKRMYQQLWRKTAVKYALFLILFFVLAAVGFMTNAFFIFLAI